MVDHQIPAQERELMEGSLPTVVLHTVCADERETDQEDKCKDTITIHPR